MTKYDELDKLYSTLPTVECKRKCQAYCGPLLVPNIEFNRIEERVGWIPKSDMKTIELVLPAYKASANDISAMMSFEGKRDCRFLMPPPLGTCRVYPIRPLVCRLWGCVNSPLMKCPWGCVPTRWLSNQEFSDITRKVIEIQKAPG